MGLIALVFLFIIHVVAIYTGAHIAQLEYIDIWRSVTVAALSYFVMIIVGVLLAPLLLVPIVNIFFGALVLGLGSAFAAKMVLSCDWQPAWIIGATVAAVNMLVGWVLSGCS